MRVLLVEDDEADAQLARSALTTADDVELQTVSTMEQAREVAGDVDVVLLDLTLPDSEGFESLIELRTAAPHTAIIVITGNADPSMPVKAIEAGAQEYILKEHIEEVPERLKLAVSRQRHTNRTVSQVLTETERRAFAAEELQADTAPVTGRHLGLEPLSRSLTTVFAQLVEDYMAALDKAIQCRVYRDAEPPTADLRRLAATVTTLNATARDLVDVHAAAIDRLSDSTHPERLRAVVEESRHVLLELMGYVAMSYRSHSLPARLTK